MAVLCTRGGVIVYSWWCYRGLLWKSVSCSACPWIQDRYSQTRVVIPRVVIPRVVMYFKVLQRAGDESKRVAMPNLFAVYSILIDAHIEYVFSRLSYD